MIPPSGKGIFWNFLDFFFALGGLPCSGVTMQQKKSETSGFHSQPSRCPRIFLGLILLGNMELVTFLCSDTFGTRSSPPSKQSWTNRNSFFWEVQQSQNLGSFVHKICSDGDKKSSKCHGNAHQGRPCGHVVSAYPHWCTVITVYGDLWCTMYQYVPLMMPLIAHFIGISPTSRL